jgi:hypothetical protein
VPPDLERQRFNKRGWDQFFIYAASNQEANNRTSDKQQRYRRVPIPGIRGMKISSSAQRKIKAEERKCGNRYNRPG